MLRGVGEENAGVDGASWKREADRNAKEHMFKVGSTVPALKP